MSSRLKQITTKAKALYKSGKYKKWTDAIKAASKTLTKKVKKSTVGAVKNKAVKKATKKIEILGASKKLLEKIRDAKKKTAKKSPARLLHKDTKSHNVNIRVMSGLDKVTRKGKKTIVHYSRIAGMPNYSDPDMARELELWSTNDSQLYYQQRRPILINLSKKYKKGTFDVDKAAKLWRYFVDNALQKYNKEFGSKNDKWYELMSVHDRNLLAHEFAEQTKDEFDLGNFTEK